MEVQRDETRIIALPEVLDPAIGRRRRDGVTELQPDPREQRREVGDVAPAQVDAGDAVVIPAGIPQRIENTGDVDLVFYCVCTPPFRPEGYTALGA